MTNLLNANSTFKSDIPPQSCRPAQVQIPHLQYVLIFLVKLISSYSADSENRIEKDRGLKKIHVRKMINLHINIHIFT